MFEWFAIGLLSFAVHKMAVKWCYRIPLALAAGLASASVGAASTGGDPLKAVDKILVGGVINCVICILFVALFAWLLKPAASGEA